MPLTMLRDTGTVTDVVLRQEEIEYFKFLKIDFAAPVGLKRFTDRHGGYTGDIDGSVQTWEHIDFTHGPIQQTLEDVLVVNWLKFANLDYSITNIAYQLSLRNTVAILYEAWWTPTSPDSIFIDSFQLYEGTLDEGEYKEEARIVLKPHYTPWDTTIPRDKVLGKCINDYRNPEDCQYVGAEPVGQSTCGKTRSDCALRGNTYHINIYDDLPKLGSKVMYGGRRHGLPPAPTQVR